MGRSGYRDYNEQLQTILRSLNPRQLITQEQQDEILDIFAAVGANQPERNGGIQIFERLKQRLMDRIQLDSFRSLMMHYLDEYINMYEEAIAHSTTSGLDLAGFASVTELQTRLDAANAARTQLTDATDMEDLANLDDNALYDWVRSISDRFNAWNCEALLGYTDAVNQEGGPVRRGKFTEELLRVNANEHLSDTCQRIEDIMEDIQRFDNNDAEIVQIEAAFDDALAAGDDIADLESEPISLHEAGFNVTSMDTQDIESFILANPNLKPSFQQFYADAACVVHVDGSTQRVARPQLGRGQPTEMATEEVEVPEVPELHEEVPALDLEDVCLQIANSIGY